MQCFAFFDGFLSVVVRTGTWVLRSTGQGRLWASRRASAKEPWQRRCHCHPTGRRRGRGDGAWGSPGSSAPAWGANLCADLCLRAANWRCRPVHGERVQPPAGPGPIAMCLSGCPAASARGVMTWEMMDCKHPANGSSQPGPGPSKPTGNVSTGLGRAGPGLAGGSSAPLPGKLCGVGPGSAPLQFGGAGWSLVTSPTAEVVGKGDGEGQ